MRARVRDTVRTFRGLAGNRDLVRLQAAFAGSSIGQWAGSIAVSVYSFERGGAGAVGVQIVCRMVPGAVFAPFAGTLADRFSRTRIMVSSDLLRVVVLGVMITLVAADAPLAILYAFVGISGLASTAFEPARSALTPGLARTPEELTAANVVASSIDSTSLFVGPALGALLLAATSVEAVLAVTAATLVYSAALVSRVRITDPAAATPGEAPLGILHRTLEGAKVVAGDGRLRVVLGLTAAQTFVDGVLGVLIVAVALNLLDLGQSGLGLLDAAVGVGGILGIVATASLVAGRRLALPFAVGIVLWGLPLALIAIVPHTFPALGLLAIVGVGNTLVDVAGLTLLQRSAPDELLGRVLGILETLVLASIAIGAALAPTLIDVLGLRGALAVTGAVLPLLALLCTRSLIRIDREGANEVPTGDLELLRAVTMLRLLDEATLERLASALRPQLLPAGTPILRQGERGDRFFIVVRGGVEVLVDGRPVRVHGPGETFGEIALLRATTRTATVRALEPTELRSLPGDVFVAAVTGHAGTAEAAETIVASRLRTARPAAIAL